MRGYLSRIVQTATRSGQQLRPLAGSIFGAPAEHERAPGSYLNNTPLSVDSAVPAPLPDVSAGQQTAVPAPLPDVSIGQQTATNTPSLRTPESSSAIEANVDSYEPLQPAQEPVRQSFARPFQDSLAQPESPPVPSHDHQHSAEVSPTATQQVSIKPRAKDPPADEHAFAPRMARRPEAIPAQSDPTAADSLKLSLNVRPEPGDSKEDAQSIAGSRVPMPAPLALMPAQSASMVPLRQASFNNQRTPPAPAPSIEIHIGRIEVVAVQPPAPPAPAPRRDRTTSLADYLAGRTGRRS